MSDQDKELSADQMFTAKAMAFSQMTVSGTVIVVPDSKTRRIVEANLTDDHRVTRVVIPHVSQLSGWASQIVVVHPDVDLHKAVQGEGRLLNILKGRTRAFENSIIAIF